MYRSGRGRTNNLYRGFQTHHFFSEIRLFWTYFYQRLCKRILDIWNAFTIAKFDLSLSLSKFVFIDLTLNWVCVGAVVKLRNMFLLFRDLLKLGNWRQKKNWRDVNQMISGEPSQLQRFHEGKTQTEHYCFKIPPYNNCSFISSLVYLRFWMKEYGLFISSWSNFRVFLSVSLRINLFSFWFVQSAL